MNHTALIIGKFMPFHQGHIELVDWTLTWAREVIVLVGVLAKEPIGGPLRWEWVSRYYLNNPRVRVEYTDEALPTAPVPDPEVSKVWGAYLKKRFPDATCISASEGYAPMVAGAMGISSKVFDIQREKVNISATKIRANPWKYWEYLPEVVRPYYRKKVALVGAESTGKTTLAEKLARHFSTLWVPELARAIIDKAGGYSEKLLGNIVWSQEEAVRNAADKFRRWLFVDSDFLTTCFYARKFSGPSFVPPITPLLKSTHDYDLYLFCEPDIPYKKDSQRSETDNRAEDSQTMLEMYQKTKTPLYHVKGIGENRLKNALEILGSITD